MKQNLSVLAGFAGLVALPAVTAASVPSLIDAAFQKFSTANLNALTSQIVQTFVNPYKVTIDRNSYVVRQGSALRLNGAAWTGSGGNVYWLGLDENVIPPAGQPFYAPYNASYPTRGRVTEVMLTMQTLGAKVIRSHTLGVSVGNPLSLQPTLTTFNDAAFDSMDWAVYQARQHGLRLLIPLTDNWDYYHGGKFTFVRWRGFNVSSTTWPVDSQIQQFYTNATIVGDFKNYIKHLLTHVNPLTGLTYAEDPTIFAYETGNELSGPKGGDLQVPRNWTSDITAYIKSLAPNKLIVDGTSGVDPTHLDIPTVDIYAQHYYPLNTTKLKQDIALVGTANKVYHVGEYDWRGSTLGEFVGIIEAAQNTSSPVVAGDLFWDLFMHNVPDCNTFVEHNDGVSLYYNNPKNTAENTTQITTIRQHLFKMQGITVGTYLPDVPCPADMIPLYEMDSVY